MDFFDRSGRPVVYLHNGYLLRWSGQRVAIVQNHAIYSLSGGHVGYIRDGWIRDRRGHAVSFSQGSTGGPLPPIPHIAPVKAIPPIQPIAPILPLASLMPIPSFSWSPFDFDGLVSS